jgi:hypothetical protein
MANQPDFVLYDRGGQKVAIVETKNKRGTTREWAAELRRNIAGHRQLGSAEFFLLVTPDHLYLWKGVGDDPRLVFPDYQADGRTALEPYVRRAGLDPGQFSSNAFELIVSAWLSELILQWDPASADQAWLRESGFLDSIKSGRIDYQLAA